VPEDVRVTDSRYGLTLPLVQCTQCGFVFADSVTQEELTSLYSQLEDADYLTSMPGRNLQMQWLLKKALAACPNAESMLDIGAASGYLVGAGQGRGLHADGIEPSAMLVQAAREQFNVSLVQGVFPDVQPPRSAYDLVFLVDVIEHVADPVGLLRAAAGLLTDRGVMLIVTPDLRSLAARLFGRRWWHYRLAHVGYFDRRTFALAASAAGLRPRRFFRACWFFEFRYLAQRLTRYLPIGWLNRCAERIVGVRALYRLIVPLNLFDSWVVVLARDPKAPPR
jgi:2-polyprenyl-3-methyl-5-hydroxy-6-metoxy-1,4-benzoquinol methylase